jgi:hypothetical protein
MSRGGLVSQSVASPATNGSSGEVSQLSQSQPDEFPLEVLPEPVLVFVIEAADALNVDPALVAGPCLATLAGCVGNRRRILIKPGAWCEPCILWIATVMRSGGRKTPSNATVLEHLQELEAEEIEEEKARQAEYETKMNEWNAAKDRDDDPPEKPEPARRLLVSDITTEGLLLVHAGAPRGLLLHRDELGGWLRSYNQYKNGKGADAQTWCEMHQGKPALIDRKGSATLSVPRAAVSIVGGIQPEFLRIALSGEHMFDGIASRILFVAPPERVKKWSEARIHDQVREEWNGLLDELLALRLDKEANPIDLPMTDEAKEVWISYYNEHAQREAEETGPMRSALAKLEAATARLALVVQLANDPQSAQVGADAMRAGIALSGWFEGQARRVYSGFEESAKDRERRVVCDWIADQGGITTRRDLARYGPNQFRKRAQEVLDDLVAAELAERSPQRGKLAPTYVLCATATVATE